MTSVSSAQPSGRAFSPVASVSRRDGVLNEIRRAVVLGNIKPGDKLTEAQLAEWLNVSRPTVREALSQLSQEGLLVQEPYRGLRVASLSAEAIMDLARTRLALDILAAECICEDASGARLAKVEEAWLRYEDLEFHPDPVVKHEAHVAFHRAIWAAADNAMLLRLWPVTEAHLTILLAQDQATRDDPVRAHNVHERLVEALRTKDLGVIRTAMSAHTIDSARELIELLDKNGENA
ncbi:GntR family transcriptional regulator [Arthrobacter sp. SW1]|uniref:GntR family transcriptional regulator n=1 Tax=Arthrobacter sp. SW1 TaxID=1920889 RepID=UPI000877B5CD|nr:GntR family transcriptional regulator [Arthrobacter sp. SW1]OFI39531.1 GntR family transcriptional regulator [Arthrobacter sp. SW1]